MGGPAQGPVFINRDGSPVSSYQFNKVFQQLVQDTFLDPRKYKPHSLRIGGATHAHQLNMSHSRIKEMGLRKWVGGTQILTSVTYESPCHPVKTTVSIVKT